MARRFQNRQRLWTVYGPTGDSKRPLKPIACVRANAKSVAAGMVVRRDPRLTHYYEDLNVLRAKRNSLVVVEGCFAPGPVLRGGRR